MKIKLVLSGFRGEDDVQEKEVPATSTTLGVALGNLGVVTTKRNLFVNGAPATSATVVKEGDTVRVTERPQGS